MDPSGGGGGGGGSGVLGGYAGPAVKAAASITTAIGALNEGTAGQAAYQYKAGMAQINKQLALQNADYTRKTGEIQAGESGMRSRFQMGKIVTGQAGSGIDINSGTAVNVRSGQQLIAQEDQSIIRSNAARKAYGYDVEAAKEESESQMDVLAGQNVKDASKLAAISSLLGGASSVADKWSTASQYGLYNSGSSGGVVGPTDGDSYQKDA